jgi:tRNA threonylcarbamoyladenosine biosynthesis protein TsaB
MQKLLAIDTSTNLASVSLFTDIGTSSLENLNVRQHAQQLLPMVDELLASQQLALADLTGIVMGCGPGSFTGLRIACSVVKGLACVANLPVYPVLSTQAIAYEAAKGITPVNDMQILALLDARMAEVYWHYVSSFENRNVKVGPAQQIVQSSKCKLILAGPQISQLSGLIPSSIREKVFAEYDIYPRAESMLNLVLKGYVSGVSAGRASPIYVRNNIVQGK